MQMEAHIQAELDRLRTALNERPDAPEYERLYAAQQALSWASDPMGFKAPYAMVMGIQEGSANCWGAPHPIES